MSQDYFSKGEIDAIKLLCTIWIVNFFVAWFCTWLISKTEKIKTFADFIDSIPESLQGLWNLLNMLSICLLFGCFSFLIMILSTLG